MRKYVRYVDDFSLFSDDHARLREARKQVEEQLAASRLMIHPVKSQLFETGHGANFVGFRILPDRIRVRSQNLQRTRKRFRTMQNEYLLGKVEFAKIGERLQSWAAHLAHGDTFRLRTKIFSGLVFTRA